MALFYNIIQARCLLSPSEPLFRTIWLRGSKFLTAVVVKKKRASAVNPGVLHRGGLRAILGERLPSLITQFLQLVHIAEMIKTRLPPKPGRHRPPLFAAQSGVSLMRALAHRGQHPFEAQLLTQRSNFRRGSLTQVNWTESRDVLFRERVSLLCCNISLPSSSMPAKACFGGKDVFFFFFFFGWGDKG